MPPITIMIKPVSGRCNMDCTYCFYQDEMNNRSVPDYGIMDDATTKILVERAFEFAEGSVSFAFQGGEPTLIGVGYYRKFVELVKKRNGASIDVQYAIQTNGMLIDDEWAGFLSENHFFVGLSLDGPKNIHNKCRKSVQGNGTFDDVIRAAGILDTAGIKYNILSVVSREVAIQPEKVYHFFKRNGFKHLQFIPCLDKIQASETDRNALKAEEYGDFLIRIFNLWKNDFYKGNLISIRFFDNLLAMLKGYMPEECGMRGQCSSNTVVEADGSVFPCDFYVIDEWNLGNIKDISLAELHQADKMLEFIDISKQADPKCKSCEFQRICRGGCRRYRDPQLDNSLRGNVLCEGLYRFYTECTDELVKMSRCI